MRDFCGSVHLLAVWFFVKEVLNADWLGASVATLLHGACVGTAFGHVLAFSESHPRCFWTKYARTHARKHVYFALTESLKMFVGLWPCLNRFNLERV